MAKILIVDDDPSIRELCEMVLRNEGFDVLIAEDAPSGVFIAEQRRPDLVLLDWMMPDVDGMEALRQLKSSPTTRDIPVIMLTALDSLSQVTVATYNGADGYVTKPFDVSDLLSLVSRFIQQSAPSASE